MVVFGATQGKLHVLHTAGCLRRGCWGGSFRAAEVKREGRLEEGDRGGPNMTHVSVF